MSNDYIMRQIEDMSRFLASVIFARRPDGYSVISEDGSVSEGNLLRLQLQALLKESKVNEAENLLFLTLGDAPSPELLPCALDFYETLNRYSDEELQTRGFSRGEIAEGLAEVKALYKANADDGGEAP